MNESKGIFLDDLEKAKKYGMMHIRLFFIFLIPLIILVVLSMAGIFSNVYVSTVFVLFMIFTILTIFYLKFECNLLRAELRKEKILGEYECMRQGCNSCTGVCINVDEWGVYICIYLNHEFKDNIDKLIKISKIDG